MNFSIETDAPRFLICRLTHIGDCVLTMPLASALKQQWPNSTITWAVQKPSEQLLKLNADIDEIITVPKNWFKSLPTVRRLFTELRARKFDVSFDPQSLFKSAALARLAGATYRLGFSGEYGKELSTWLNNRTFAPKKTHLVDRTLEMLNALGASCPIPEFKMQCSQFAHTYVKTALGKAGVNGRYCVINPGASWQSKQWDNQRFGEVARQLKLDLQIQPVITWAGQAELEMAKAIVQFSRHNAILAPDTNLEQFAALSVGAELFVGCDTGPMHIASGMGTPCVVLHGPTLPERSGAYGGQHVAIQKWFQDGSAKQRRRAGNLAMRDIQVKDVLEACELVIRVRRRKSA